MMFAPPLTPDPFIHRIIIGDARSMAMVNTETIHLIVTSPPYWQLKDYGNNRQIGYDHSYEQYINHLNLVWQQCFRVLRPGCRLCIVIGDQFARASSYGRYKVIPIRTEIIKFCEIIGFDYMGAVIWQKLTTTNTSGGAVIMGSYPYPRNGILKVDYEFILIFKKSGKSEKIDPAIKKKSKLDRKQWNEYFSGHWRIPGQKQSNHLAEFPLEIPLRLIRMFSFVGDLVLDPFLGSGTTSLAAMHLQRESVGIEINQDYLKLIEQKLAGYSSENNHHLQISFADIKLSQHDLKKQISLLPYIFQDSCHLTRQKKSGRHKATSQQVNTTRSLLTVKKIIEPDLVRLSDGKTLRLLGIKILSHKRKAAVEFLRNKTKSQKVYVIYDNIDHDQAGNRLGYLYLSNKTFLNAHLIKAGLAMADESVAHRYQARFVRYQRESDLS